MSTNGIKWKLQAEARRLRREATNTTLEDLGAAMGLSAAQLSRYERGKAAARADIIERWDAALDRQEHLLEEEVEE